MQPECTCCRCVGGRGVRSSVLSVGLLTVSVSKTTPKPSGLTQAPFDDMHGFCGSGVQTDTVGLAFLCSVMSETSAGGDLAAGIVHLDLG